MKVYNKNRNNIGLHWLLEIVHIYETNALKKKRIKYKISNKNHLKKEGTVKSLKFYLT